MNYKGLKNLIVIAIITYMNASRSHNEKQNTPLGILPVTVGNLMLAGPEVPHQNLKLAVNSPQHKGQLMLGFMQYMYLVNNNNNQTLEDFTTVLFYSLLQYPNKLDAQDYKNVYNLLTTQQYAIYDILEKLKKKYALKNNDQLVNAKQLVILDLIANVARGKFKTVSPFILYIILRDTNWNDFEHIFSRNCRKNNHDCLTIKYYQKSLVAIADGSSIYLNCAPDDSRLRQQYNFSLYNGNIEWIKNTQINDNTSFAGPITLSGLNNDALDGEFGSLWARVCKLGEIK